MILAVTGHRPPKLGGYSRDVEEQLLGTAMKCLKQLKPDHVITGMALGWDQAIARAAVNLNITFTAAIPFRGQESKWPQQSKSAYHDLIIKAGHVFVVSTGKYSPAVMMARNHWMVDKANCVLSLWDGQDDGGTAECVRYARVCDKPIYNAWPVYKHMQDYAELLSKLERSHGEG